MISPRRRRRRRRKRRRWRRAGSRPGAGALSFTAVVGVWNIHGSVIVWGTVVVRAIVHAAAEEIVVIVIAVWAVWPGHSGLASAGGRGGRWRLRQGGCRADHLAAGAGGPGRGA